MRLSTVLAGAAFALAPQAALAVEEAPASEDTGAAVDAASEAPAVVTTAKAAEPPSAPPPAPAAADAHRPEGRELGGHVYMPVIGIVGPFATTSFGTFLTMGAGSTEGHVTLQIPGASQPQTFGGKVSYAAVGGVLGFEWAFLRDVSARGLLTETLYSGMTGAAAAVIGTNARLGGNLGLTAGLPIGRSLRVAGVFDMNLQKGAMS